MFAELLSMYFLFFRMGAVTFGGGYAMLPILEREIVQKRKWLEDDAIIDYYALSQGLPGIIAINVSVFIGYKRRGVPGAVSAALGMVSPCIIIISTIAFFLANFQDNVYVRHALSGISVCVSALIVNAVIKMWKRGVRDIYGVIIFAALLLMSLFTHISPIILIIACALAGILIKSLRRKKSAGGAGK